MKEFLLTAEFIELVKILKIFSVGQTGGQAKNLIKAGFVKVNGKTELRVKAKLRNGDVVENEDLKILITSAEGT